MLYFRRMARIARLQLLSSYETIELAEQVLAELMAGKGVGEESTYWVSMALREALANAIKHGNKLNPDTRVGVDLVCEDERLRIEVVDEGQGFDVNALADPTAPENVLRQSGRGIFYMRHFMDEVNFSTTRQGGTRVELIKNLGLGRNL